MRMTVGAVCLIFVMSAGMLMLAATRCEAAPVDVRIHLRPNADPIEIFVQDAGKFVGLCRSKPNGPEEHCSGNEITWELMLTLGGYSWDPARDKVVIVNAPNHPSCFGPDPVATFTAHLETHGSGTPSLACTGDKYGTYWPYVIEFWHDGELKATTDPGGIIFP